MKNKKLLERYFWRGVFDTDGMIDRKGKHIVLASSDDNLIKQCQEFLKKLGIRNSIKSKKDNDGNPYKTLEIESGYIKDFATLIGTSHPLKQRILYSHLQKPLKYYILQNLNRINITKDGKFNLKLLKNKDKRVSLPECPSTELLRIASYVSVIDSEKKRIIFRTKGVKFTDFQEILNDFEVLFGLEPKFLSTRNMWYVNSQLVNEFFRKFFIYDLPWNPLQKDEVDKLLRNWNGIYGF